MTEALKLIKEESTRPRSGLLRELNLFGYEKIEDVIIAALVTGDPLLLVGTHGTAKTMLCENIAKAMGKRFIAYDASKALFEDVLGFPNPYSMEKGEIDYISTPISIQGKEFVLIDEISRANYQLQGKWLEVIRSRRIMGKKIEGLHYIFGAMNPPSYVGARTLDAALSGRFAFIVEAPDFSALDAEAKESVLDNVSEDDAVVLNGSVGPRSFASSSLQEIVGMAKEHYQRVENECSHEIRKLILALEKHLTAQNFVFDGRRAGMVKRGLTAILSVRAAKGVEIAEGLHATFRECLPHLLPYSVEMDDFNPDTLSTLLEDLFRELYGMTVEKDDMK
jgi:MoxR-like ATPase